MILVQNKREGLVYGPRSSGGHFTFKPGKNEVPKEYLDGLDEHGIFALENLFQDGVLSAELPQDELAPAAPDAPQVPADVLPEDEAAALAVVASEGDRKKLSAYLENERREKVFDALVDKLSTLDGGSTL